MNARLKDGIVALLNKNNVNGIKQQASDLVRFFEFHPKIDLPQESRVGPSRTPKAQRK